MMRVVSGALAVAPTAGLNEIGEAVGPEPGARDTSRMAVSGHGRGSSEVPHGVTTGADRQRRSSERLDMD